MNSHDVIVAPSTDLYISAKAKHLLVNVSEWSKKNAYKHFVFATEKRAHSIKSTRSSSTGVYIINNYQTELFELLNAGVLKEVEATEGGGLVSYSVNSTYFKTSTDHSPFTAVAIKLLQSNRLGIAELLSVSPDSFEDTENNKILAKGTTQPKELKGRIRFMRPQQITFAVLLCLADESGVVRIEHGRLASMAGCKKKTLQNHLLQFRKLGLFTKQIGGFVGEQLLGKAPSVFILKIEILRNSYQIQNRLTKFIKIDNSVRENIRWLIDLASLRDVSDRLKALKAIMREKSNRFSMPDAITDEKLSLCLKAFQVAAPLGDRPQKHLCLLIEKVVITELSRSGFKILDPKPNIEDRGKDENEGTHQAESSHVYRLLSDAICEILIGPLFSRIESVRETELKRHVADLLAHPALALFDEIQSAVIQKNKGSIGDGDELRQKKLILRAATERFFSSTNQLVIVD